jgi:Galactose oxidase, central domain/Kelch motif
MLDVMVARLGALALFSIVTEPALLRAKPADSIEKVATLRVARAAHTATTLSSGKVMIVGGMASSGGSLDDVELFDPARNTLRQVASLANARAGHTATLLSDGRVLITGGYDGEYLQSVEIFDLATDIFKPAGALVEPRSEHTATLLPDGRVLLVGGVGRGWTFLRSAELYDPATGRSTSVGPMSAPREGHTATLLADGRVLVIGGHSGRRPNVTLYASAEIFDPRTGQFEAAGSLGTPRHKHDAILLTDGRVLVIAGADVSDRVHFATTEIYTPATGSFEPGPSMRHRRYKIARTSVLLPNGNVLVTSGARSAELFDVGSGAFREIPGSMPDGYRFAAAALLRDGDVLISGGYSDRNETTNGVWRFRRGPPNAR